MSRKLEIENKNLEYKKGAERIPKDLWETYSAFANTEGGVIKLGISEIKAKKYEITGIKNAGLRREEFLKMLSNPEKVSVNLINEEDVYIEEIEGKEILIIKVPEAHYTKKPVYINGHKEQAYKRVGESDNRLTEEEYKYFVVNSSENIDGELLENYDLEDLNMKDIITYRDLLAINTKDDKYMNMTIENFLKDIGVLKRNRKNIGNSKYHLTVGGLLFFGKYNSIIDYNPYFQLEYMRKNNEHSINWLDRVSVGDKDTPDMNIFSFYSKVSEKLFQSIENRFNLSENQSRDSYLNDMTTMLREVFTNSIVHAYYGGKNSVKIINYDDYWEFYNAGNMRISKDEFIHGGTSDVRNSIISILFRRIGYVERAGSGGPRIFDTINKYNLKVPEIVNSELSTTIRIWKLEPMEYYQNRNEIEKRILELILENGHITKKIALKNGISEHKFWKNINNLIEDNIVITEGKARGIKYLLKHTEEAFIQQIKKMLVKLNDEIKNLNKK